MRYRWSARMVPSIGSHGTAPRIRGKGAQNAGAASRKGAGAHVQEEKDPPDACEGRGPAVRGRGRPAREQARRLRLRQGAARARPGIRRRRCDGRSRGRRAVGPIGRRRRQGRPGGSRTSREPRRISIGPGTPPLSPTASRARGRRCTRSRWRCRTRAGSGRRASPTCASARGRRARSAPPGTSGAPRGCSCRTTPPRRRTARRST